MSTAPRAGNVAVPFPVLVKWIQPGLAVAYVVKLEWTAYDKADIILFRSLFLDNDIDNGVEYRGL